MGASGDPAGMGALAVKLWLDDERPAPLEWFREGCWIATTAKAAIDFLQSEMFDEVSLDHDLGPIEAGTGYDVICWIEERVFTDSGYRPPLIHIHTANPSARRKMQACLERIQRSVAERDPTA